MQSNKPPLYYSASLRSTKTVLTVEQVVTILLSTCRSAAVGLMVEYQTCN